MPAIEAAASLRSTTSDMLKFLKANLFFEDDSGLSSALRYCMSTRTDPMFSFYNRFASKLTYGVQSTEIGLGWVVAKLKDIQIIQHSGGTEGFSTTMILNPDNRIGAVVLTNAALKDNVVLSLKLLKNLLD